ncbi:MAG: CGGC domain-containing protein [Christensenellales bacterium]
MKIGIIRCMQTEDMCPATVDFQFAREKKGAFENIGGEVEIIAVNSCGGCPGKKAVPRAMEMARRGAEAIALASCITRGNPIGYPCPFAKKIRDAIAANIDDNIKIIDYTH